MLHLLWWHLIFLSCCWKEPNISTVLLQVNLPEYLEELVQVSQRMSKQIQQRPGAQCGVGVGMRVGVTSGCFSIWRSLAADRVFSRFKPNIHSAFLFISEICAALLTHGPGQAGCVYVLDWCSPQQSGGEMKEGEALRCGVFTGEQLEQEAAVVGRRNSSCLESDSGSSVFVTPDISNRN